MKKAKLVFIIATSRSGTTMMCRILNLHRDVFGTNELHYFNDMISIDQINSTFPYEESIKLVSELLARVKNTIWHTDGLDQYAEEAEGILGSDRSSSFKGYELFELTMDRLATKKNVHVVVEQTPKNVLYLNQLNSVYKNAKFINMIRDPRAVLLSQKNRWTKRKSGSKNIPIFEVIRVFFNYHPYTIMKLWNQSVNVGRKFDLNANYIKVKFENLLDKPEIEIRKVCSFIDINYDPAMLDVPQMGSSNIKNNEEKRGINKSVNEEWKTKLGNSEIWLVEKFGANNMKAEGYERIQPSFSAKIILYYLYYPVHVFGAVLFNPKIVVRTLKVIIGR